MNADILARVRKLRKAYIYPLKAALQQARFETSAPRYAFLDDMDAYPSPYDKPVTGTVKGLTVSVVIADDDESQIGDDDVTGTFTDSKEPGAIQNNTNGRNGQGYKWYAPANYRIGDETGEGWRWFHENYGMSRQVAREYIAELIRDDMRQDADRYYLGVVVTVSVDGQKLGSASLWCIDDAGDSNTSRPYLIDTAANLIDEALEEVPGDIGAAIDSATSQRAALIAIRDNLA
jgi:hypothetical protein